MTSRDTHRAGPPGLAGSPGRSLRGARALLAAAALGSAAGCAGGGSGERPPVVLVTLDTTRADHLGCYGYARDTSPRLDAFARDAVLYERALSTSTWTLPAHASLFTGKFASSHGAQNDPDGTLRLSDAIPLPEPIYPVRTLSPDEITLAALLQQAGYATGAVVGGPWLKRVFGLDRGFDRYDDEGIHGGDGRASSEVTDRALAWLRETRGRPAFLFVNYFDPHEPYAPPAELAPDGADYAELRRRIEAGRTEEMPGLVALYDAEIRAMDQQLGRLFDGLKQLGLYDPAWIVVTSDHGELLGERDHAVGHGPVYPLQGVVRVPLLVKKPGGAGAGSRQGGWVQLVDLLPLLLDGLGLPRPAGSQGGAPPDPGHPLLVEVRSPPSYFGGSWTALVEGDWKYIHHTKGRHMLFDLARDPGERHNLVRSRPEQAGAMGAALERALAALPAPAAPGPAPAVDRGTREALEQLGYLGP